mmetsp:Transcript_14886/g.42963  ORF Transcript_14886/g.42963 Transcript_14886/m.42963 type:complete len:344 (+) Transcript_14886:297-1328(+)
MEPSAFCVHRANTGILSLGDAFEEGAAAPLGEPNKERVGRAGAAFLAGATFAEALGVAGFDPPKKENAGLGAGAGAGAGSGLAAGLGLKKEKAGAAFGAGAGVGAGSTFFGAGFGLKNEKDGAAFGAGAGVGAGAAFFGAGFLLSNNENEGAGALGAGFGAGEIVAFGAGLGAASFFPPNKDEKASVTGSLVSIFGAGFASTLVSEAGVEVGALKRFSKLREGRGAAGAFAFAAGAAFFGTAFGAGAGEEKRLKVGRGAGAGAGPFGLEESKSAPRLSVALGAASLGLAFALGAAFFAGAFVLSSEEPKIDPSESAGFFCGAGGGGVLDLGASRACFSSHSRA